MKEKVSHVKILFPEKPSLPMKTLKKRGPKVENYKKKPIPTALREAVWIVKCGKVFEHKCLVTWCPNTINVYDFQAGHNIPESYGGPTNIDNLIPICSRCNNSMGDRYTIDEWNAILGSQLPPPPQLPEVKNLSLEMNDPVQVKKGWLSRFLHCFESHNKARHYTN
jgi:hypothetical protein